MTESGESKLPLQYEDGPDFCTVRDAQGRDFALTMQPDLMKAMEKALSDEIASFMRAPVKCSSAETGGLRWQTASEKDCSHALYEIGGALRRTGKFDLAQDAEKIANAIYPGKIKPAPIVPRTTT